MSPSPSNQQVPSERSEAYKRCMQELSRPDPNYQAAQLYATLSLEEALRDMTAELAEMGRRISVSLRRL